MITAFIIGTLLGVALTVTMTMLWAAHLAENAPVLSSSGHLDGPGQGQLYCDITDDILITVNWWGETNIEKWEITRVTISGPDDEGGALYDPPFPPTVRALVSLIRDCLGDSIENTCSNHMELHHGPASTEGE